MEEKQLAIKSTLLKVVLLLLAAILSSFQAANSITLSIPYTFVPNTLIQSAQVNANFSTIASVVNGQLDHTNLSGSAGILLTQLNLTAPAIILETTGLIAWGAGVTGDSFPRVAEYSDGTLRFGIGGSTGPDVALQRSAAGTLQLQSPTGTPTNPVLDMNGGSIINAGSISGAGVPYGSIVAWWSTSGTIPTGWALCNGQTTTWQTGPFTGMSVTLPNLIGVMIQGADITGGSSTANPNGFGSQVNQSQQGQITHTHTYSGTTSSPSSNTVGTGSLVTCASDTHTHTYSGTTASGTSQPAVYAITYIMKL